MSEGGGRVMTTMRLPETLMQKLAIAARAEGRSRSNLVENILTNAMANLRPSHESDFYTWTKDQAAALRDLAPALVGTSVDIDRVAEEIADLGLRELREVESYLRQLFVHLLKLGALPQTQARSHWIAEALEFQARAAETFEPGMRHAMNMPRVWALARHAAATIVAEMGGNPADLPTACPFDLDTLVSPEFDLHAALASLHSQRAQ